MTKEPTLNLTTDMVTQATGLPVTAGTTIDWRYDNGVWVVRLTDSGGRVLADWTTVRALDGEKSP